MTVVLKRRPEIVTQQKHLVLRHPKYCGYEALASKVIQAATKLDIYRYENFSTTLWNMKHKSSENTHRIGTIAIPQPLRAHSANSDRFAVRRLSTYNIDIEAANTTKIYSWLFCYTVVWTGPGTLIPTVFLFPSLLMSIGTPAAAVEKGFLRRILFYAF